MKNIDKQENDLNNITGGKKLEKSYDELKKNIDKVKFKEDNDSTKDKIKYEMSGLRSEIQKQKKIEKNLSSPISFLEKQTWISQEKKKVQDWVVSTPNRPAKEIGEAAINILTTIENSSQDSDFIAGFIGKIMNLIMKMKL